MRKIFASLALAALAALGGAASAQPDRGPDDGMHSIQVFTRNGPFSTRITLGVGKAVIVQLDADVRDVLVGAPSIAAIPGCSWATSAMMPQQPSVFRATGS